MCLVKIKIAIMIIETIGYVKKILITFLLIKTELLFYRL
jgi:hypothetical protein